MISLMLDIDPVRRSCPGYQEGTEVCAAAGGWSRPGYTEHCGTGTSVLKGAADGPVSLANSNHPVFSQPAEVKYSNV